MTFRGLLRFPGFLVLRTMFLNRRDATARREEDGESVGKENCNRVDESKRADRGGGRRREGA